VVPVFYGTDRKSEANTKRASYSSERGKRLEMGRALVTVPKSHEVPNVERPWVYKLPFTNVVIYQEKEDPALHFTLKEVKALSEGELVALVRERLAASRDFKNHVFVFVHGFNNSFDAALFRTAQIAYDLKFDGAPFLYSWPSKGALGVSDYSYDRESSGQAQPYLKAFLDFVVSKTGATSVSVIAHSMGNQLLLPVLRDLKRSKPAGVTLAQIILAAPDVDRDTFEFLASEIQGVGRGITVLAASNDRALDVSRRFWGGVPRAGDIPVEGPVLIAGIDTIDVTAVSTDVLAINHSGYAQKRALINDMRLLIQTGERPPERRVPILERVKTPRGDYWKYPDSMR
jgi:esterase/lipase superfamily enzyme